MTVRCDIAGRDQGGFVADAQQRFAEAIKLPTATSVEWLGMFENLARARHHFLVLIPLTIGLIYVLFWVTFGSPRAALLVLLAVPFACIGGVLALYVRGMHLNMSSAVGFTALFGVAIMDGVLMVRWISTLRVQGMALEEAIVRGALERLRPILMTSIVAIFGLLPASLATGLGSDVQRPLATVIVWGLFSSTTLTLFVVPVFYRILVPGSAASRGRGGHVGGRRPVARRAPARRDHAPRSSPCWNTCTAAAGRWTIFRICRRDQPRVRPRDRRRQGGGDARLRRHAGAHGRPDRQGQAIRRGPARGAQGSSGANSS